MSIGKTTNLLSNSSEKSSKSEFNLSLSSICVILSGCFISVILIQSLKKSIPKNNLISDYLNKLDGTNTASTFSISRTKNNEMDLNNINRWWLENKTFFIANVDQKIINEQYDSKTHVYTPNDYPNSLNYPYSKINFTENVIYSGKNLGWKILAFVDIHFLKIGQIWWTQMLKLGYDNILIMAMDLETFDILKTQIGRKDINGNFLKEKHIRMSPYSLESFVEHEVGAQNVSDLSNPEHRVFKRKSIWKIRIRSIMFMLEEGYSLFLSDVDSVWLKYYDLNTYFPDNIDAFFIKVNNSFPGKARKEWNFVVSGGVTAFRPTAAILKMHEELMFWCSWNCDDQIQLNYRLLEYGIKWLEEDELNMGKAYNDKIGHFYKFGYTNAKNFLRAAVFDEKEAIRGGSNCNDTAGAWMVFPIVGSLHWQKIAMFNRFTDCMEIDHICNPNFASEPCYQEGKNWISTLD